MKLPWLTARVAPFKIAPPDTLELLANLLLVRLRVPQLLSIAPPYLAAVLCENVQSLSATVAVL